MNTGSRIKAWRERKGLTRGELAAALGVVHATVYMWETDGYETEPSRKNLDKLLELFGITLSRFYGPLPKARKRAKA